MQHYGRNEGRPPHPEFGHVGPSQSPYLGPEGCLAYVDSLQQHFQVEAQDVMTLIEVTREDHNSGYDHNHNHNSVQCKIFT